MRAVILGITGYTGLLLTRLLAAHPEISDIVGVSSSRQGELVLDVDPGMDPSILEKMQSTGGRLVDVDEALRLGAEVVFSALPHLQSARICAAFVGSAVVIDFSADLRISDAALFEKAYGAAMPDPALAAQAVYGLCEWYHEQIAGADVIANPGCYPTSVLLPLLPPARESLLEGTVVVNSGSGISGAGRKPAVTSLFCERAESYGAYLPGTRHRHVSEMVEQLAGAQPDLEVLFTPHLVPMKRGIATTIAVRLSRPMEADELAALYERYYGNAPFVRILRETLPATGDVWGSNRCDIAFQLEGEHLLLFSAIDNLVKGASGQAVQNMNIRFGFPETAGLPVHGHL